MTERQAEAGARLTSALLDLASSDSGVANATPEPQWASASAVLEQVAQPEPAKVTSGQGARPWINFPPTEAEAQLSHLGQLKATRERSSSHRSVGRNDAALADLLCKKEFARRSPRGSGQRFGHPWGQQVSGDGGTLTAGQTQILTPPDPKSRDPEGRNETRPPLIGSPVRPSRTGYRLADHDTYQSHDDQQYPDAQKDDAGYHTGCPRAGREMVERGHEDVYLRCLPRAVQDGTADRCYDDAGNCHHQCHLRPGTDLV